MVLAANEGGRRGRPPVSERRRDEQRLAVAREAVRLFLAQGVAATSGAQIAAAAGISERSLWRLFRAKEACVEPLLSRALADFEAVVRSWPPGSDLADHLRASYRFMPEAPHDDTEAVLAIVRLGRDEPALRAVWLVLHERVEPAIAGSLARRATEPVDAEDVRVLAALTNTALRVAIETFAWSAARDGASAAVAEHHKERLAAVLRAVTGMHLGADPAGR